MELYPSLFHLLAIQAVIIWAYYNFIDQIQWTRNFNIYPFARPEQKDHCPGNRVCPLNISGASAEKFKHLSLGNRDVLFVHFHRENGSSWSLVNGSFSTHTGPVSIRGMDLVWVENISSPLVSLDLGFNVFSFTTLGKKVHHMSIEAEFESISCFHTLTDECRISSFAVAFLTEISKRRGSVCTIEYDQYECCKQNNKTNEIECGFPPYNPQIGNLIYTLSIIAAILFLCFPACLIRFPDEVDSSETLSANTQARDPLYRVANWSVLTIRNYSSKYYVVNVIKRLVVGGLVLPIFLYIDFGLTVYTSRCDLPKMFQSDDTVIKKWVASNHFLLKYKYLAIAYYTLVAIISLLPRTENLPSSLSSYQNQESVQNQYSPVGRARNRGSKLDDLAKDPWNLTRNLFVAFSFGFKGEFDGTHFGWRIIRIVVSCFLILFLFPLVALCIFFGCGLYVSPTGREIASFFNHADTYFDWFACRLTKSFQELKKRTEKRQSKCAEKVKLVPNHVLLIIVRAVGSVLLLFGITVPMGFIVSTSLLLISRLISYLFMGIVANNDDYAPFIAFFSLFIFYIWSCLSSVGNEYRKLLNETFNECKEYQEKQEKQDIQVILSDSKGPPRIRRLSELFQKVVDEILPFSTTYIMMCAKIVTITLFLCLTYFSVLVFGEETRDDLIQAFAVLLGGLIPKFVEIFTNKNNEILLTTEKRFRIRKIVEDFFDQEKDLGEKQADRKNTERSLLDLDGDGLEPTPREPSDVLAGSRRSSNDRSEIPVKLHTDQGKDSDCNEMLKLDRL